MAGESEQRKADLALIEEGNKIEDGLSTWEMNFIDDLNRWMKRNETLTVPQRETLEKILAEKG